jgi:hypothetical protein
MTSQTKKFIELSDIVGLRIQCKHAECHATLLLPILTKLDREKLLVCPYCQRPWTRLPTGSTIENTVEECARAISKLSSALNDPSFRGFALSLEIKQDDPKS